MAEMTDYIKIESYLKDVPDNFLIKEIQQPTGEYPPVLVVAEYNRRKRMRNAAQGQQMGEPTSLVEDIKQEAGLMSAPGAMQTLAARDINQMGPPPEEMRPMPQQMFQQMPQQMPMGMAEGGLVAFERGGPIRAFEGIFTGDYTQATTEKIPRATFINELSLSELQEYNRTGKVPERLYEKFGKTPNILSSDPTLYFKPRTVATPPAPELRTGAGTGAPTPSATAPPTVASGATPRAAPSDAGLGAFKQPKFPTDQFAVAMNIAPPTDKEIEGIRKRAETEFETQTPDRTSQLLENRILRKTEEIQKDKDMSFNDALIAAGAAILKSPGTPGSLAWMGEGLSAFGTTLKEGKKDIRKSEDLLDQANIDLATSQSLRDQGKIAAADKAENKAYERFAKARALAQTDAALALQRYNAEVTGAKLPYEIAETGAKARYYGAAAAVAGMPKPKAVEAPSFGEVMAFKAAYLSEYPKATKEQIEAAVQNQFPGYRPMLAPEPIIRGAGGQGATLPGT